MLPVRLSSVVRETCDLLQQTLPRSIEMSCSLDSDEWVVEADPAQLSQVLMNFCINARDAMPHGGQLHLSTDNVDAGEECTHLNPTASPGRYVRLGVQDTGSGMSEEVQKHLFEPFFTTKEVGAGTGLGLYTAYGIVRRHRGYITVDSEPGTGSAFYVHLPAIEAGTEEIQDLQTDLIAGTETLLAVDDEEAVLELAVDILERCGYTVLKARNGAEAMELYRKHSEIGLVILDLIMPQMDGWECIQRLRALDSEARVLIATGHAPDAVTYAPISESALRVIDKPYSAHQLSAAVREALDAPVP
jgi:CheY-like chemotaxis protein